PHTRGRATGRRWGAAGGADGRAPVRARRGSRRAQVDPNLVVRARAEERRRAPAADRDRDVPVGVLVQDDVARARVGEGPGRGRVEALEGQLELDGHAGKHADLLEVAPLEVQLHVPEVIDVEDGRADAALTEVPLGNVTAA